VRLALGVGRARLLLMLALEAFLTATVAGALSIGLAWRVPQMVMNAVNPNLAVLVPLMHPSWRVFGYLSFLVAVATFASSLAPMHAAWKLDLVTALKGREGASTMRSRLTGGLIIAQIAMTFVLIAAAVMFGRMPGMISDVDAGFDMRHTLSVPLSLDMSPDKHAMVQSFYRVLEERIRAIPGVKSLAYENLDPFRQSPPSEIRLPQQAKGNGEPATIDKVSTDFFPTFGIRMIAGRPFSSSDSTAGYAGSNAVISEAFAKQFWPGEDPIGKIIIAPDDKRYIVVGVAADTRSERFGVLDGPRLYILRNPAAVDGKLYVGFAGSASAMERAIHDTVKGLDDTQGLTPQTIWEELEANAEDMRSLARIVIVMASIAVLLAITGVYGVLSFVVNQRRREFGVRMVLGANRAAIFRHILMRGCRQVALGLAFGLVLAEPAMWAFARLVRNSPYPIRSFDPSILGIASFMLAVVAFAAMYLPALRATQVDPIRSLRVE
jgi:putative ABC transport system permease protein